MTLSVCSSQSSLLYADEDHYSSSDTLRQIVTGALSIAQSGALSISASPADLMHRDRMQKRAPASKLQQMLTSMPLLAAPRRPAPLQKQELCYNVMPAFVQQAWHAAAGQQSAKQHPSRPSARRCLCLSLAKDESAFAQQDAAEPYTPTKSMAVSPLSPASSAAVAAPLLAGQITPAAPVSSLPCQHQHYSTNSSTTRLQEWLGKMELQLQIPTTPVLPLMDPCPAPKGRYNTTDALERRKRTLAAVSALSLSSAGEREVRSTKRRSIAAAVEGLSPASAAAARAVAHVAALSPPEDAAVAVAAVVPSADADSTAACANAEVSPNPEALAPDTITGEAVQAAVAWLDDVARPPAFTILGLLSNGSDV